MSSPNFKKASSPTLKWIFHFENSKHNRKKRREILEHAERALRFIHHSYLTIRNERNSFSIIFPTPTSLEFFDAHFHFLEPIYDEELIEFRPEEIPFITPDYLKLVRRNLNDFIDSHSLGSLIKFSIDYSRKMIAIHADSREALDVFEILYEELENGEEFELVVPPPELDTNPYNPDSVQYNFWQRFQRKPSPPA